MGAATPCGKVNLALFRFQESDSAVQNALPTNHRRFNDS